MQRDIRTRLTGRKFLSVVLYCIFVFASEVLGWPISYEAYAAIGGAIGVFVVGESYIDGKAARK